jgi:RHS repeat-associated protein
VNEPGGARAKKTVNNTAESSLTTTEYAGNYIYEDGNLQFFNSAEGYIEPVISTSGEISSFDYIYQYKDHLGNIRLSYSDADGNGTITQAEIREENNYYPFGLEHKGYNNVINGTENNYQTFQGQELEEELGKNTLAFQWRDYDPAIARFNKIDRFSEKYYDQSPYNFTKNSPMVFQEVKGDSIKVSFRTGFLGIFGKKQTLTYDSGNQQWNDENGKQYTGKTSKFSDKVLGDLKKNQGNELGNEIVSNLANDNIDHFVKKGSPNSNTINDVNIYYNGSVSDDGQKIYQGGKSGSSPGYVVLGHEMAHKYSRNLGVRNVPWFGAGTADARGVDEYNAMYYENVLRGANGLQLRSAYSENGGSLQGTILNSSGNLQSPPTLLSTQSAPTMPAVHAVLILNKFLNRF